jgi:hypothetical protein
MKPHAEPFRDITTAPRDGSVIVVRHGPHQVVATARWSSHGQGFVREADATRRLLQQVTGWRPVAPVLAGRRGTGQAK